MNDLLALLAFTLSLLVYEPPATGRDSMAWIREHLTLVTIVLILFIIIVGSIIIYLILTTAAPPPPYP